MKLGLGTVQFGLNYGISNKDGIVPVSEVKKILDFAYKSKIKVLDTASLYGSSERVLGECITQKSYFNVITKTPKFSDKINFNDVILLRKTFNESLARLNVKTIYGLLIHHADNLLGDCASLIWDEMRALKKQGLVEKIGVSVYSPDQLNRIIDKFKIDIVQLPVNVFDQRFLANGMLTKLKNRGIEIHARSIFLQGLLLMPLSDLPQGLIKVEKVFKKYQNYINLKNSTSLNVAINFVNNLKDIDHLIIGVCSNNQLKEIVDSINMELIKDYNLSEFACYDEQIVNPSLWT